VQKGTLEHRRELKIGEVLRRIRRMVYGSDDARATALAELREAEQSDPFKVLIGTILSHRTRDEQTALATDSLFLRYRTADELANADENEVKKLIRPVGFYNMKTRNVIRAARQVRDEFGGVVPDNIEDLLKIHAVGRKTANCVLVYAFNKPAIPVDTHVHRISNRLGLVETKTPEETEVALLKLAPKRYWLELNELFVMFGQTVCKPVGPRCSICSLRGTCRYYREVVSKRGASPSRSGRSPRRASPSPSRS
jgi:endonuclease-3